MSSIECVGNKAPILSIFSSPPSLDQVDVHEVRLHRDGPTICVRFDVSSYPEHPPQKWAVACHNRVQVTLRLSDVSGVQMNGWGTNNLCRVELERVGEFAIRFRMVGAEARLECSCAFIEIENISAYRDGRPGPSADLGDR